ncbi:ESCRT-III subunit protein did4 [Lithohypha guttulata]|uniref:ESCRT-III subunit protein did4 n=1 Tax=Lithohypha guttulata TaxID=1690604 RepID=A0AAN7SZ37_9EURO|nr:ESCRT-III subunit protein did4 [Lithohypha guttulata]
MNIIEWAFGKRMTPQEKLRKHQRALEKTMRELDREKRKLEDQQNKLQRSIKQHAEKGQLNAAKVQAKDLARTRKYIDRFNQTTVQLKAISLRIQMMQSMKGATKIIGGMNRSMNLPALSKIAQDFERENDIMEQRQEMMEDAVDDALGDPAEEEESEETINQILDELGVEFNSKLGETPSGIQSAAVPEGRVAQAIGGGDDALEARLASLRK